MNTSMTINATAAWLLALYVAVAERHGVDPQHARGHDAERHRSRSTCRAAPTCSRRALAAADQRHDRLHRGRDPAVEPDQRLLATTCRRRARRRCRRSRTRLANAIAVLDAVRARARHAGRRVAARVRAHLVLPATRASASWRRSARCARWPSCGTSSALERYGVDRRAAPPLPLRRAGEQPRPHRGAAREQRAPHRARGARRDALEEGALPRAPAARLERGARPAAALGPAVVAAHPADPRLRDRPARVRRHLRRLARDRGEDRRAEEGGAGGAPARARHGRRDRRRRERAT